jgi:hypothetical protein
MADWLIILGIVGFVAYKLDSLTELDVGRGWLRLKFAQDNKRLVEARQDKRPVRRKQMRN